MFHRFSLQIVGFCGLLAGALLMLQGVASATSGPGTGGKCTQTCENRQYIIDGSNAGKCIEQIPADCAYCAKITPCQCLPTLGWKDPNNCVRTSFQTAVSIYPSCGTPCNSVLSPGYTEGSSPTGTGTYIGLLALWQCQ